VLLLTGRPGVGKTTVVRKVATALAGRRLGGFYSAEIREGGVRRGFRLATFDGEDAVMADVERRGPPRVGKYGVDVAVVDGLSARALAVRDDIDVYLVDEIGKMECLATGFVTAMRTLLDSSKPVVATIAARGPAFAAEVKARPDVELLTITPTNRDDIPARVLRWLATR
jgi:nucleoside-triphosphatase